MALIANPAYDGLSIGVQKAGIAALLRRKEAMPSESCAGLDMGRGMTFLLLVPEASPGL